MGFSEEIVAAVLGVIQGLTEFLPVSSSGHLVIVSSILDGEPLPLSLNIALHLGTLAATMAYFWRDWVRMGAACARRVAFRESSFETRTLIPALVLGTIPAGIIGLLWQKEIEILFHNPLSVTLPLALVGLALWAVDSKMPSPLKLSDLRIRDGILIGFAQATALIPGVSRSGATILGGRILGLKRDEAARFSFLLGTPAMAGAALLNLDSLLVSMKEPVFYIGFVMALVTGVFAIGFMLRFLRSHGFGVFALYRLVLAAIIFAMFFDS